MKSLRIYIVEDEPLIVATIETSLRKMGHVICGDADNVSEAIVDIKRQTPNLVLIDINLEGNEDGIDLATQLSLEMIPYLFLTSQTDPETISRVKTTSPLGYIVKPFTEASLQSNIELAWHNYSIIEEEFIVIKADGKHHKINQEAIKYLKAFDNYCYIVTVTDQFLVPHTLKHTAKKLNEEFFIKTHRSYVVNSRKITGVSTDKVILEEDEIPLSGINREIIMTKIES